MGEEKGRGGGEGGGGDGEGEGGGGPRWRGFRSAAGGLAEFSGGRQEGETPPPPTAPRRGTNDRRVGNPPRGHPRWGGARLSALPRDRTCLAGAGLRKVCKLLRRREKLARVRPARWRRGVAKGESAGAPSAGIRSGGPPCGSSPSAAARRWPRSRIIWCLTKEENITSTSTSTSSNVIIHHQMGVPINACLLDGWPLGRSVVGGRLVDCTTPHCVDRTCS